MKAKGIKEFFKIWFPIMIAAAWAMIAIYFILNG